MPVSFDATKFVMVNRQNRPTTVYDRNKRQVRVAPISHVQPHQPRDRNATYVLTDPFYVQYVSDQGPLYLMGRKEAEALLGRDFPVDGATPTAAADSYATPVGQTAAQQAAAARATRASRVATPAPTPEPLTEDLGTTDVSGADEVELHTLDELGSLPMADLKTYGANWNITGRSKQIIIDRLVEAGCVAPDEV